MKLILLRGKYGEGKFLKVSDEDFDFVSSLKIHVSNKGYAKTYFHGKHVSVHTLLVGGRVDHRNRDRLDDTRENLRPATIRQNNANVAPRAKSGFKGVIKDPTCNSYEALISVDGKMVHLGNFRTKEMAALAYDLWAVDLHGQYAKTNFPLANTLQQQAQPA